MALQKGPHTVRVSVDNGNTFVGAATFVVPYTRDEAASPWKNALNYLAVDIAGADPTPANCAL